MPSRKRAKSDTKSNTKKRKRDETASLDYSDEEKISPKRKNKKKVDTVHTKSIVVRSERLNWIHWVVHPEDWSLIQEIDEGDFDGVWTYECSDKSKSFRSHPQLDSILPKNAKKSFKQIMVSPVLYKDHRGYAPNPWIMLIERSDGQGVSHSFKLHDWKAKVSLTRSSFVKRRKLDASSSVSSSHTCKETCNHDDEVYESSKAE